MGRSYLVTGGAGFIGSNFIRQVLDNETGARVTNLDALTYAGVRATINELDRYSSHHFVLGDIRDADLVARVMPGHDVVVHFAAESHVDRSIDSPAPFIETNVVGTGVLLDAARRASVSRFVHVSTDEVYGSFEHGYATEEDVLNPSSPYSASKAGSDLLALAYTATHGTDVVVTRCTNNYGPYQFPEKVIPLFVTNLLDGKRVPLYGDGRNERDWLHVQDHCSAIRLLVDAGQPGEIYNIGADAPLSNLALTEAILDAFGVGREAIEFVPDRRGHDLRYALDSSKVRALGWSTTLELGDHLASTIRWYRDHEAWWRPLKGMAV